MCASYNYESVADFYAGKSVFITGGAGYLGKVIIEKLLYSCPLVEKIYVLLRDKRNISAEQRLKNILTLPIFSRIQAVRPHDLDKIVIIKGDIKLPGLNMSKTDTNTIIEKVSVVIHSAASIKFNDPCKVALETNYEGTKNLISICHRIKNIKAFVYMSTAYSNTDKKVIEEVLYPPPSSVEEAYKFAELTNFEDHQLTEFLNGRPNTYTFTKAMAENLVVETHGNIPSIIIRPSIVTPSIREPVEGWVDNWFGATGLLTLLAKGICRAVYADKNTVMDLIPVDYVSNLTIVAATRANGSQVSFYNSCSGDLNPITIYKFRNLFLKESVMHNFQTIPWPKLSILTKNKLLIRVITWISFFFAYLGDVALKISFQKPKFTKYLTQAITIQELLEYFTANEWTMRSNKTMDLYTSLSEEDASIFPFNPKDIYWDDYIPAYFRGVSKYLIKNNEQKIYS